MKIGSAIVTQFVVGCIICAWPMAGGENWPQWRGPSNNGVSAESELPTVWTADDNITWSASLAGLGASSPIVHGDRVIVTSQIGSAHTRPGSHPHLARDDQALSDQENPIGGGRVAPAEEGKGVSLVVEAFSLSDGRRLWKYETPATGAFPPLHEKHNLATPTPVTDGELIYAWFGNGQLVALNWEGKPVWSRHLGEEFTPFENQWGHGSSPVLYGDLLVLLCDHRQDSYLLAVDKKTGEQRWKVDRGEGRVSHSTPVVIRAPEGDELLVNSSVRVDTYNPADGELLWFTGSQRQTPIPTPVFHDGVIYMARGYRNSDVLALRPGARGEIAEDTLLWRMPSGASYVPSILYFEGLVYMTNEIGVVTCADAKTGERVWRKRLDGIFFASPVAGDGKVYMVSETGETLVLKAGRDAEVLARNDLGVRLIASPAISDGKLFLRSDDTLFAIGK